MFRKLRTRLADLRRNTAGNATVLVAVGLPALIGGSGLAVDTAQWYLWKRELQHSVDQAALSAAWAMSNEDSADNYEERAMQEFTVNQNVTRDFTSTPQIALADFAGGDDNSVVVTATATKALPFSNFLTGSTVSVRVQAQARFAAGGDYRACLVALGEDDDVIDRKSVV